jgi:hypothetical protein
MKRAITDASRMTAIRKLSPFLIVCRIGILNCQFGWLRGSLKRKDSLVAEACNVPNALIIPFRIELFRPAA